MISFATAYRASQLSVERMRYHVADRCTSPALIRAAVVYQAMLWLHTPYHHAARIKHVGVDCAQLLCAVFEEVGLVPPIDTGSYPADWHLHRSEEIFTGWLARYAHPVTDGAAAMLPGDVLLFQFGRCFSHASIVVSDPETEVIVAHAYLRRGVILSRLTELPLAGRPVQHWSLFEREA